MTLRKQVKEQIVLQKKDGCQQQSEVAERCFRTFEKQELNPATFVNEEKTVFRKLDLFHS